MPSGVNASPVFVPADQFWVVAVLAADDQAELGGKLSGLEATCRNTDGIVRGGFEQTVDLVHSTADQLFNSVTLDRIPVAVTPSVPFQVELLAPETGLPSGGRMKVQVSVKRDSGFAEPIRVRLPFLPPWVTSQDHLVVAPGEDSASFELEAYPEAADRNWQLVASASVDVLTAEGDVAELEGRQVCSNPVDLSIIANPVQGTLEELACERGKALIAHCRLEGSVLKEKKFIASLEGLPARITAEPVLLSGDETDFEFRISVTDDAPLGIFEGIRCRLTSQSKSEVSYVVARDTRLTVFETGKLRRNAKGELLSPLEALRHSK